MDEAMRCSLSTERAVEVGTSDATAEEFSLVRRVLAATEKVKVIEDGHQMTPLD